MSADHPLLASLAETYGSRMIVYKAGHEITAILDGQPHDAAYMRGALPDGLFRTVPRKGVVIGDLVSIAQQDAIESLFVAGMIAPETRH